MVRKGTRWFAPRGRAELKLAQATIQIYLVLVTLLAFSTIANERLQKGNKLAAGKP